MTEVNIPLLRKAVEWAEAEAQKPRELREWEQDRFFIPASNNDPNVVAVRPGLAEREREQYGKAAECGTCYCIAGYVAQVTSDAPLVYREVEGLAVEALGITEGQGMRLFDACNRIEDVRRIAEDIAGERL